MSVARMAAAGVLLLLSCGHKIVQAANCTTSFSAGAVWPASAANTEVYQACSNIDPTSFQSGLQASRSCNGSGTWAGVDFTPCVLLAGTQPFALVWMVLNASTLNNTRALETQELSAVHNYSLPSTNVTLLSYARLATGGIAVTFRLNLNVTSSSVAVLGSVSLKLDMLVMSSATLGPYSLLPGGRGYQIIVPTDSCQCKPSGDVVTLCTGVTQPCSCSRVGTCKCLSPFVGDGTHCTLDGDGDGYPATPLDTCLPNSTAMYCMKDVCPYVFDPKQNPQDCEIIPGYKGCPFQEADPIWGISWANTPYGATDMQKCINSPNFATRVCTINGWMKPNTSQCQSYLFINIGAQAQPSLYSSLVNTVTFTSTIISLTSSSSQTTRLQPLDLNTTNFIVRSIVDTIQQASDNGTTLATLSTNLLSLLDNIINPTNVYGWLGLQEVGPGSPLVLTNTERLGNLLSKSMKDSPTKTVYGMSNYVLATERVAVDPGQSYLFPSSLNDLANSTFSSIPAQIKIPYGRLYQQLGGANTVPVTTAIYASLDKVLPVNSSNTSIASVVISAQISQQGTSTTSSSTTSTPITISFTINASAYSSDATFQCIFWNALDDVGNGYWETTGLTLVRQNATSDGMMVLDCESTHLTCFAVLVDVYGTFSADDNSSEISSSELEGLEVVSYIGCAISLVCLLLAVCFLLLLGKSLLVEVQYFIHLNLSLALCAVYIIFVAGIETARTYKGACIFVAALLHYSLLASFCWMLCEGVMLYVLLVLIFRKSSAKWWYFFTFGWGAPLVVVAISVGTSYDYYGVRDSDGSLRFCWLSTKKGVIWAFVAPMLVSIVANVVFLAMAVFITLRITYKRVFVQEELSTWKASRGLLRTLLVSTSILLPILGVTWAFGILAVNDNTTAFVWLFTISNSLQGVFIFIFHVVQNRMLWKRVFPKWWMQRSTRREASGVVMNHLLPPSNATLSQDSSPHNSSSDLLLEATCTATVPPPQENEIPTKVL